VQLIKGIATFFVIGQDKNIFFILKIFGIKIHSKEIVINEKKEKETKPISSDKIIDIFHLWRPVLSLISKILNLKNLRYFNLKFKFGFGDPYTLGLLYGVYQAMMGFLTQYISRNQIYFEPDFSKNIFEGELKMCMVIPLYSVIIPAFRILKEIRKI
jgi:hypothetical protein